VKRIQKYCALPAVFFLNFYASAVSAAGLDRSIVLVIVTKQAASIESPWEKQATKASQNLGTVVEGGFILVTAYAVADAKLIEMKRVGQAKMQQLKVKFVDKECNLALLEVEEKDGAAELVPLDIGGKNPIGTAANLYSAPKGGKFILHQAYLSAVGVYKASTSYMNEPNYLFKVQGSGFGWSEPILSDGKIIGIAAGQNHEYTYAIPSFVIEHFLSDKLDGDYRGFPTLGITTQALGPGNLRTLLNGDKVQGGVRVVDVSTVGPFRSVLRKNDIIVNIAKKDVDGEGMINDSLWGPIAFTALITNMYAGDEVTIKFLRDGVLQSGTEILTRFDSNARVIPYYRMSESIPHLIFGGLVFQEVTYEYLMAWGDSWRQTAPSSLVHLWDHGNDFIDPGSRRIVMLNRIMADEFNFGYEELSDVVVQTVNGLEVKSLAELESSLRKPLKGKDKRFSKLGLGDGNGEIILGYDDIEKINARISANYGIGTGAHVFKESGD
jgi:S1-C subfamily serine protease